MVRSRFDSQLEQLNVDFEQRESGLRGVVVGEGWSLEPDSRGEKGKGTAKPESAGGSNQVEISRARGAGL